MLAGEPISPSKPKNKVKGNQNNQKRRRSIIEDRRTRLSETPTLCAQSPAPQEPAPVSEEELRQSFDEWMKIVADNASLYSKAYLALENQCF